MYFNSIFIVFSLSFIMLTSCASTKNSASKTDSNMEKHKINKNLQEGKLINMEHLDGCGWVIQLKTGNKIQPINLRNFELELEEDKTIFVKYKPSNMVSVCQIGEVVEIEYITTKK